MVGGEHGIAAGRAGDVDAVHPDVAGVEDVDEEAEPPPFAPVVDQLVARHVAPPRERRGTPATPRGSRTDLGEPAYELGGLTMDVLVHLYGGQRVDLLTVALSPARGPHLTCGLDDRG